MNVYRIKKLGEEQYLSSSSRSWTEIGTIFTTFNAAKRAVSYSKRWVTRMVNIYSRYDSLNYAQQTATYRKIQDELNKAKIIEYDMVRVKDFELNGVAVCEPIAAEDKSGVELNECDCSTKLDRVDFAGI